MLKIFLLILFIFIQQSFSLYLKDDPDGDGDGDEDDKVCGELVVPGIDRISRGIDITELDLTPPETARTVIGGVRSRLIDFTCNREEKWQHPQTEVTYDVPDQVQRPATLPTGSLKAVVRVSGDSEELKKSWSTKVGAGLEDVEKFGFSASVTFKGVQESLHQNNKTMAETTAAVSTHMVDFKLPRHLKLTDDFSQFFDDDGDGDKAAVAKYEENPRLYDKFVRQFGTHYFESATFGGSLYMKTQLVERYVSANSEDEIESNLEAKFLGKFNVNAETDHKRSNVSDSFESSSKTEIVYYGGWLPEGVTTDNPDWYPLWTPNVNRDPWLTGGRLKSIADLFWNQKERRREVKKAIKIHLAASYLAELKTSLSLGRYQLTADERKVITDADHQLADRKRRQDVDSLVERLDGVFKVITAIKDRIRMLQLRDLWEEELLDVINCKSHVLWKCAQHRWEKFEREADSAMDFYENVKNRTVNFGGVPSDKVGKVPLLDHEEMRLLYRDARNVAAEQRKSLGMCATARNKADCETCVSGAVSHAYSHPAHPFCKTVEARKAVKAVAK